MNNNLLIHSDNIIALNYLLDNGFKGKIDLVYIDPPYATGGNFTIINGRATTISNSKNGNITYTDTLKSTDFIAFLRERLILLRELLSERGSI
jgi:adenine-specific DNA-methyltransferase